MSESRVPEWKQLEERVAEYFRLRMENEPLVYHRFYDTHAAGGFLPAQPADHLVVSRGTPILIETKYTSRFETLVSCFSEMVDDNQIANTRMWSRAGAYSLYLFEGTEGYELWDGDYCARQRTDGKRLKKEGYIKVEAFLPLGSKRDALAHLLAEVVVEYPGTYRKFHIL